MGISGVLALTMNDAAARLLGLADGLLPASLGLVRQPTPRARPPSSVS